jgi:hypothetical protein
MQTKAINMANARKALTKGFLISLLNFIAFPYVLLAIVIIFVFSLRLDRPCTSLVQVFPL